MSIKLEDAGVAVIYAASAQEAYDLLRREAHIDLLFTAIRLPSRLDGFDLNERARALQPALLAAWYTRRR